ncbi:MAG: hypothetical protein PHP46_05525, partial [Candidatus Omnitrophica bacterium]|nr:hypothetical protein [Candidatus Omnitrophota bacterium]
MISRDRQNRKGGGKMLRYLFRMFFTVFTACVIFSAPAAIAGEAEMMAEINALKVKIAEMESLKIRVAELEKKLEIQGCSITTQGTTVQQIRESLIEYKPGEGLKVPPCGIEITAG